MQFTRFSLTALILALFALPAAARAQTISVYGTASPAYLNHLYTINNATPPQTTLSGKWFIGADAGVTFTFHETSPVTVGLDFRGGPEIGTTGLGTALAGLKLGFKPPVTNFKPYAQLSLGFLEQRHPTGSGAYAVTDAESYFVTEILAGVDYPIARHIDVRALEVGVGATRRIVTNGVNTATKPYPLSLSSGIVFNF
jgi:hypothetical protein